MSTRHTNSVYHWCLTGALVGSLLLGGSVISLAGPFSLTGKSRATPPAQTELQKQMAQQQRSAAMAAAGAEEENPITSEESEANAAARIAASARKVKLNFIEASWSTVLSTYAKQVGVELVAQPSMIPRNRFNRPDRSLYTQAEGLEILNKELHRYDLRLVREGQRLVLQDIHKTAPNYRRPTLNGSGLPTSHELPASSIKPAFPDRRQPKRISEVETTDARETPISGEPFADRPQRIQLTSATDEAPNHEFLKANLVQVPIQRRKSKEMANLLYRAFQKNCELVNNGPEGLPAIRVFEPAPKTNQVVGRIALAAPKRTEKFTLAIDHSKSQATIEAAPATARAVANMVRLLDVAIANEDSIQLFASDHADQVESTAEMVQKQVNRMVRARNKAPAIRRVAAVQEDESLRAEDQPEAQTDAQPEAQPRPRQPTQTVTKQPGVSPDLLEELKGDVTVESVPDLGVMILKGNKADVDRVMAIIREIEKLSVGSAPDVHLLLLKSANSEALAGLLTQVYERLNGRRQRGAVGPQAANAGQLVTVIPVVKPNAILIIASAAEMESILKLAEELDQPIDASAEFKMFRLKTAVASQVLQTIETFYEGRTTGLGARVLAVADVRTNSVLVHAQPSDLAEVAALVKELDEGTVAAVSQMKIFPLKNAVAIELSDILQQTLQSVINAPQRATGAGQGGQGGLPGAAQGGAAGQGSAALRDVKSTVLQFLSNDGPGNRLLRSGILADIRVTADGRTNSLVVTAPEDSMILLEELIKQLDRQTSTVAEIKVFTLSKSDAKSMVALLQQLFASASNQQNIQDRLGIQVAGAEDASSGLVPLKFSVDTRTNSIVAVGAAESLRVVEAILIRLDESEVRERQSVVFRLKNSPAANVATAVNNFLTSRRDLETSGDGLVSPFEQIEREVIVVPESISNTLLISATPRYFKEIQQLVITLDAAPQQVTIQALLVEVTLDNADEFGVELGLQDSVLFRRSVIDQLQTLSSTNTAPNGVQTTTQNIISQTAIPGFLFNNQQLGNNTTVSPGLTGKQGLTSFSLGRQNQELGYGGLVLAAGSNSVSVLLRALSATRRVDVLSRPQIRTLDNQLAVIQVGQEIPVVNGFTQSALGVNPTVEIRQAGIILQVVPRISPDGRVVMDVAAERSAYLPDDQGVVLVTDGAGGRTIRAPRKDISTARASVAVSSEQTVVLGGMISSNTTSIQRKVPIIGDLPFLGLPFRYSFNQNIKKELLIFLTPRVIKTDADSEYIKQIEAARIHFMESDAEELHGPIMSAPAPVPTESSDFPSDKITPVDDPTTPTTQMQPGPTPGLSVPEPPFPDDGPKMMRRGTTKPSARPVAMSK